jgi:CSLREA domain-containing protein
MPIRRIFAVLLIVIASLAAISLISAQSDLPLPLPSNETEGGVAQFQDRATVELLTNGGFEVDGNGDKLPDGWKAKKTELAKADKLKCNKPDKVVAYSGNCAFQFSGNLTGETSKLMQTINPGSIPTNSTLILGAYVDPKNGVPLSKIGSLSLQLSDGSKLKQDLRLPANAGAGYVLQSRTQLVTIPAGLIITNIKIDLSYGESTGKYLVDEVRLTLTTADPTSTPITPSATSTVTLTPTHTSTGTLTATNTPTASNTPTQTSTPTATFTSTATFTPTSTNTPTATNTPTNTATSTPTNTPTNTATSTPTPTPTPGVITINSTADTSDLSGGSGACANSAGQCTLRAALQTANYDPNENIIRFATTGTVTLGSSLPAPTIAGGTLTIDGVTRDDVVITGNSGVRAFSINGLGTTPLTIKNLTFSGFNAAGPGTAIYVNNVLLTIDNVQFFNNTGTDNGTLRIAGTATNQTTIRNSYFLLNSAAYGGAISVDAPQQIVNIVNTVFDGNSVTQSGGALYLHAGQFRIVNSLFNQNTAVAQGGAIFVHLSTSVEIVNTTISNNQVTSASSSGGGILGGNGVVLINSTVAGNSSIGNLGTSDGDGIQGDLTLANSIVANNGDRNCTGNVKNNNGNLQYPGTTCGAGIGTADPLLQPLNDNGGGTLTYALGAGSPAIDSGWNSARAVDRLDLDGDGNTTEPVPFDQRGIGYSRVIGSEVDSGAFEVQ